MGKWGSGKKELEVLALSDVSRVGGHPDELCYVACGVQGTCHVSDQDGSLIIRHVAKFAREPECHGGTGGLGRTVRGDLPSRDPSHNPINLYSAATGLKRPSE